MIMKTVNFEKRKVDTGADGYYYATSERGMKYSVVDTRVTFKDNPSQFLREHFNWIEAIPLK